MMRFTKLWLVRSVRPKDASKVRGRGRHSRYVIWATGLFPISGRNLANQYLSQQPAPSCRLRKASAASSF
jgi:hypothetical protein